jgi:hypothetical protein
MASRPTAKFATILAATALLLSPLALSGTAGATIPAPTTIASLLTNDPTGGTTTNFEPAFLPDGHLLVLNPAMDTIVEMAADGSGQRLWAKVPSSALGFVGPSDIAYDSSLGLVFVSSETVDTLGHVNSLLDAYRTDGSHVATVVVTSYLKAVFWLSVAPTGDLLLASSGTSSSLGPIPGGLVDIALSYTPSPLPSVTVTGSTTLLSVAVNGAVANPAGDVFVCESGNALNPHDLTELTSAGSLITTIPNNQNCSHPAMDGANLLVDINPFLSDELRSVSVPSGASTTIESLSNTDLFPTPSGSFVRAAVMPPNVVGGTPGGLLITKNLEDRLPVSEDHVFLGQVFTSDSSDSPASRRLIATTGWSGVARYSSVAVNPATSAFAVVDQYGGSVTTMTSSGANQAQLVANLRIPTSYHSPGRYPVQVAIDPTRKYMFVLDALNNVYRFPIGGALFSSSVPKLPVRQVPIANAGTVPLAPSAIGLNGTLLYLGFRNVVYKEPELGGAPQVVVRLTSGATITAIDKGPSGDVFVAESGPKNAVAVLSAAGRLLRTLASPSGTHPIAVAQDGTGHVYFVDSLGRLDEVANVTGAKAVVLLHGAFNGVAADKSGDVVLTSALAVKATSSALLGLK